MTVGTIYEIPVVVVFPGGDIHAKPTVENSTDQNDVVLDSNSAVQWELQDAEGLANDNLEVTGVSFFTDAAKTQPTTPAFLDMPGRSQTRMNWRIEFNGNPVPSEVVLYYTLHYKDDDYRHLDWDPTLTVKPRGS